MHTPGAGLYQTWGKPNSNQKHIYLEVRTKLAKTCWKPRGNLEANPKQTLSKTRPNLVQIPSKSVQKKPGANLEQTCSKPGASPKGGGDGNGMEIKLNEWGIKRKRIDFKNTLNQI